MPGVFPTNIERFLLDLLDDATQKNGNEASEDVISVLEQLIRFFTLYQRVDEAIPCAEKLVKLIRALHGQHHTEVQRALHNLVLLYEENGKIDTPQHDEALRQLENERKRTRSLIKTKHKRGIDVRSIVTTVPSTSTAHRRS